MALIEIAAQRQRDRTSAVGRLVRLRAALVRFALRLNGGGMPKQLDPADRAELERTIFG